MALKVGSSGALVTAWQELMNRRFPGYERTLGPLPVDGYFGYIDRDWQKEYQTRIGAPATGVVSDTNLRDLGLVAVPPPRARHLGIVFRGTGGVIGQDYVSRVCQAATDLIEERNPDFPASMGGLPPGAPGTPSARKAVDIGFESGCREIESGRSFILGGYSLGAWVVALLRQALEPGGRLEQFRDNYVCSFSIGDPTRPFGGSYYLGPILAGQGISSWRYGDAHDYRHCWLTHPDDMYGNIPLGVTGDIMDDAFDLVTGAALNDPLGTVQAMLPIILGLMEKAGVPLPSILGAIVGGVPALITLALPVLIGMLPGLIAAAGGNVNNLTGPAAAAQAAIIALRFAASGTAPHINYHAWEVWPGQTYLGLAIQHVRDWSSRIPARV